MFEEIIRELCVFITTTDELLVRYGTGTVPGTTVPGSIEFERVLRVKLMKTNFVYFVYIIIFLKQNG